MQRKALGVGQLDRVLAGRYCVGCGACAAVSRGTVVMSREGDGTLLPHLSPGAHTRAVPSDIERACPFSSSSVSEDELAREFLGELPRHDTRIGGCICAGKPLFCFHLSDDINRIIQSGATSAYYPVHLEDIVTEIRETDGTVAITAIPCFAKAIRQICRMDAELRRKIKFIVGIVCGHMKSHAFAESLAWQVGVNPVDVGGVGFRHKITGLPANHKGFAAYDRSTGRWTRVVDTKTLLGGDWGLGLLKNPACDFCDDVLAETADVSVGDAWLPEYVSDSRGHSIIVVRNSTIEQIVSRGMDSDEICVQPVGADTIADSQAGGLRHRREGLRYRLWLKQQTEQWHPPKRVAASCNHISRRRRHMYRVRTDLAIESLLAFERAKIKKDFLIYQSAVRPLIRKHRRLQHHLARRIIARLARTRFGKRLRRLVRKGRDGE